MSEFVKKITELENRLRRLEQTRVYASTAGGSGILIGNQLIRGDLEVQGAFVADKKIVLKDPEAGLDYVELTVVMVEDTEAPGVFNPILQFSEGCWFKKDVYTEGFFGSNSRRSGVGGGAILLGNRLTGIDDPPRISLTNSEDSGGSGATATAQIEDGKVVAVNVVNGGSGYTSAPKVILIQPPDVNGAFGTGAEVTASINNGQVVGFTVHEGGSGYTAPPDVYVIRGGFDTLYITKNGGLPNGVTRQLLDSNPSYLGNLKVYKLGVEKLETVAGKPVMQAGSAVTDSNGVATVTFDQAFQSAPKVFVQVTGEVPAAVSVTSKNASGFTVKAYRHLHQHIVAVAEATAEFNLTIGEESTHTHIVESHTHSLTGLTLSSESAHTHSVPVANHRHLFNSQCYASSSTPESYSCSDDATHTHSVPVANHRHLLNNECYASSSTPESYSCSDESAHTHNVPVANHRHLFSSQCYASDEGNAGQHSHGVNVFSASASHSHGHNLSVSLTGGISVSVTVNSANAVHSHGINMGAGTTTGGPGHEHSYAYSQSPTQSDNASHSHTASGSATHTLSVSLTGGISSDSAIHAHSGSTDNAGIHNHIVVGATQGVDSTVDGVTPVSDSTSGAGSPHRHTISGGAHSHTVIGATQGVDSTVDGSTPLGPSTSSAGSPHAHTISGGAHTHEVVGATQGVDATIDGSTPLGESTSSAGSPHSHTLSGGTLSSTPLTTNAGSAHTHTLQNKPPYARGLTFRDNEGVPFGVGAVLNSATSGLTTLWTEENEASYIQVSFDWFAVPLP